MNKQKHRYNTSEVAPNMSHIHLLYSVLMFLVSDDYQTNASLVRQLLDLIVDQDCSPHKFLRGLRLLNEAIPIQQFVDDTGMNVLHMLVTHERMSLLKVRI